MKANRFVSSLASIALLTAWFVPVAQAQLNIPSIPSLPSIPGVPDVTNLPGISDITGLINQVNQYISKINSGEFLQAALDSVFKDPQYAPLKKIITASIGKSGIPDPEKAKAALLAALNDLPAILDARGYTHTLKTQGTVTDGISHVAVQNVLGTDGQARLDQFMQTLIASSNKISSLTTSSQAAAAASSQLFGSTQQLAATSGNAATSSASTSDSIKKLGQDSQSLTSTQDVLKKIADQNGNSAAILSNISSQLGNNSSQTANVSNQLSTLANQNSFSSQQNVQNSVVSGQALQLQKQQLETEAALAENQSQTNDYLSQEQKKAPLEMAGIIGQRMPLSPSR